MNINLQLRVGSVSWEPTPHVSLYDDNGQRITLKVHESEIGIYIDALRNRRLLNVRMETFSRPPGDEDRKQKVKPSKACPECGRPHAWTTEFCCITCCDRFQGRKFLTNKPLYFTAKIVNKIHS